MRTHGIRGWSKVSGSGLAGIWRGMSRWQQVCLLSNIPLFALYCLSRPAPASAPAPAPPLAFALPPSSPESVYVVEMFGPFASVPVRDPFRPLDSDSRDEDRRQPPFQEPTPLPDNPEVVLPVAFLQATFGDTVLVRAHIDEEGNVEDVSVLRSSGDGRVDREAAATLRQWRYYPVLRDGQPVRATEDLEMAVGESFREQQAVPKSPAASAGLPLPSQ